MGNSLKSGLLQNVTNGSVNAGPHELLVDEDAERFIDALSPNSPIRIAYEYWLSLRVGPEAFPNRADINPVEIGAKTLVHIVLMDIERGASVRYRYSLAGGYAEDVFGGNYAGRYLDEMGLGEMLTSIEAFYAVPGEQGKIGVLKGHYVTNTQTKFSMTRIAMPMAWQNDTIGALFCALAGEENE